MGPETGVVVYESVAPDNPDAKRLDSLASRNLQLSTTDSNGIFPDRLGFFSRNRASLQFIQENPGVNAVWKQELTISMQSPVTGRLRGALSMRNVIEARSDGVTLTRGQVWSFPKP